MNIESFIMNIEYKILNYFIIVNYIDHFIMKYLLTQRSSQKVGVFWC